MERPDERALLRAAEPHFEVLVTLDTNLPRQQNLQDYQLGVIVLRARSNRLSDLMELMPQIPDALNLVRPGTVITLPSAHQ
jgi:hypothetical protein